MLFSKASLAQNFVEDVQSMYDAYRNCENMSFDVQLKIIPKDAKGKQEVQNGIVRKAGVFYYVKFSNNEMIVGSKFTLLIDNEDKEIDVFLTDKNYQPGLKDFKIPDSLKYLNKSVVYKSASGGIKCYTISSNKNEISRYEICLDSKTKFITKLIYEYNASIADADYGGKEIEINYVNINLKDKPALAYFDVRKYISEKGTTLILNSAYKGYVLKDLTKKDTDETDE